MSGVFISYRRSDSGGHAGRLHDRLVAMFGSDHVFMDIDAIEPGEDWTERIQTTLQECDVVIALIGDRWLEERGGRRRIDDVDDMLRQELVAALSSEARVIPTLVAGAELPRPQDLPKDIAQLAQRQAFKISDDRFNEDVRRLSRTVQKFVPPLDPAANTDDRVGAPWTRRLRRNGLLAAVLLLAAASIWLLARQEKEEVAPIAFHSWHEQAVGKHLEGDEFGVVDNTVYFWADLDLVESSISSVARIDLVVDGEIQQAEGAALAKIFATSSTYDVLWIRIAPDPPTSIYPKRYGDKTVRGQLAARDARHRARHQLPRDVQLRYVTHDGETGVVPVPHPKKWLDAFKAIRWP